MKRLPTKKHHCTIRLSNGYAVSYLGAPGFIDSTLTIPLDLIEQIAASLGHPGGNVAIGSDCPRTEQVGERAYVKRAELGLSIGLVLSATHVDYTRPVASYEGSWEAFTDYSV